MALKDLFGKKPGTAASGVTDADIAALKKPAPTAAKPAATTAAKPATPTAPRPTAPRPAAPTPTAARPTAPVPPKPAAPLPPQTGVTPGPISGTGLKPLPDVVNEVIRGDWGNGDVRKQKLTAAGYNYDEVQRLVNAKLAGTTAPKPAPAGGLDAVVTQVIRGDWGNGDERKQRLTAAGYNYDEVQRLVNAKLAGTTAPKPAPAGGADLDTVARQVIRGEWGNGEERKQKLTAAGYDYAQVQARVNALLK